MKNKLWLKIVSLVLVISTLLAMLPITAIAEGAENEALYIKSIQLARADGTLLAEEGKQKSSEEA